MNINLKEVFKGKGLFLSAMIEAFHQGGQIGSKAHPLAIVLCLTQCVGDEIPLDSRSIRSRLVRDEPREELNELAGGRYGETVLFECFYKLSPGKPVLLGVVEEAPKQRVNDVFFEGI